MFFEKTIAYVYAKAVFSLATEQNNIIYWKTLLELFSKVSQNFVIKSLCYRLLSSQQIFEIFINICECYEKLDFFSKNFVRIVSENNRVLLFPVILEQFNSLNDIYMNVIAVKVISATKLHIAQIQKISTCMTNYLSKMVKIECSICPNIIGGIIIRIEDVVIDGSVKGRILRLRDVLQF
ncbi:ATP synthase subunit delta [Candidatus Blochmanniella vafra str. BVAF]|uniref:ATP synthase subunit delta n=1 Tax=Blochmanniella vafra (strain BVAF) TaxID=859654 RepID=E8Q5V0_BLOVB|nr:F0F1 ATP synthase subunit delta [Candidatus Blochmannia vafer]ADV33419.1 ATP synthase subunit delta [Candidatus Blochmannia vafer str. BVAF]